MRVRRLLSHLAQFASFSNQGELLCTQGLAYLLENPEVGAAFGVCISKRAGKPVGSDLTWRAEVRHKDGRRPDLEAYAADGKLVAMIEAKLGAALGEVQLGSYVADLTNRCVGVLLLVLVPRHRDEEMTTEVPRACSPFALNGDGPWQLGDTSDGSVAVIYWEEVLEALGTVCSEPFAGDLAQFQTMYPGVTDHGECSGGEQAAQIRRSNSRICAFKPRSWAPRAETSNQPADQF